jgi:hypothetical protein
MDIRSLLDWRNAAPGTGVLMSAGWLAEQFATAQMWFSQIPFGWLAIASFAFWLGYDLYHPRGRLREAWRYYNAFVNFGSIYQRQVTYDRRPDHGGSLTHVGLMLPVTFRRTVTIEAVRMTGYAYRFHGVLPIETDAWAVHVWKTEIGGRYLHGDTADLALAHFPYEFGHPGYYGELGSGGYYLSKGTAHVVVVEIIAGRHVQKKQYLVLLPDNNRYWDGKAGNPGGRFIVFEEGNALFPALPADKSGLFQVGKHTQP